MEARHTPGPWWATESGVRDRGGYICHTRSAQRYPGQDERFERETRERAANKALIAAAPELLEFAQGWLSRQGDDVNYMTEKARATIHKANGQ